ncbi:MAG: HlyD family efflux transporter periplasmic adaptor subunit [Pseudonocardia sp.]
MTPRDTDRSDDTPDAEDFAVWQPPTLPGIKLPDLQQLPADLGDRGGSGSPRVEPSDASTDTASSRHLLESGVGQLPLIGSGGGKRRLLDDDEAPTADPVAPEPVKPHIRKVLGTGRSANGPATVESPTAGRRMGVGPLPPSTRTSGRRAQPEGDDIAAQHAVGRDIASPAPRVAAETAGRRRVGPSIGRRPEGGPRIGGRRHPREDGTGGRRRAAAAGSAAAGSAAGLGAAAGYVAGSGGGVGGNVPVGSGGYCPAAGTAVGGSRRERIDASAREGISAAGRWSAMTAAVAPGVREAVGPGAPPWRRWTVATSLLVPLAMVFVACGVPASSPTTAKVARSSVSSKVTGTGALRAITEQSLGFETGGKLTQLNATVGQEVQAGQVLAAIDDFDAQSSLRKAQAALDREQAALDRIEDAERVDATSDDAESAEEILEATEAQADEINSVNAEAVEQADRRVTVARANLRRVETAHRADATRCRKSLGGDSRRKPGEVNQPGGLEDELFVPAPVESAACDRARKSEAAVAEAASQVSEAIVAAQAAQQKRNTDKAAQRVAVENARREARAAKHEAEDAENSRPHDIDEQEAIVEEAQAEVSIAARDVENTVLRAPVSGKVAAINGTIGEYINSGSPATPLAPGSRVSLPDVTTGVGPGLDTSKGDRPGGSAFMVLDDVNSFQVVVPFEESDAARVQPNQKVELTFDSVPDLTRMGTVVAVAPTGTNIQDVTNYYVTVVLNEVDPRLKEGQTAQANVIIGELSDVLVVPSSAVQQGGRTGVVTVLEPDGVQRQVQVQLGMTGDGVVQILSGLREGQEVVIADES